jgi:hypothetical protein
MGHCEKCGRRIYGPKKEKERMSWKKLLDEEFHNLYLDQIFRAIKSRKTNGQGK